MAQDNIEIVRGYAINLAVAQHIQQMLKMSRDDDMEPAAVQTQDFIDKQIAARIAQTITGFGAGFGE